MENNTQHLSKQALPTSLSRKALDYEEPLPFRDWRKSRASVIPTQEYALYNQYLTDWYRTKKDENSNATQLYQTKLNYLSLLKELQMFFTEDEKDKWYGFVNFGNENDILRAIPYFAKKLKEIALYYVNVRKKLKNTKIQYNLGGTNTGLSLQIREHILNGFTKNSYNTLHVPKHILDGIPELDSVKKDLVVSVEEVYDDHAYQDQSLTIPVSSYFDLNDEITAKFFKTKGLELPKCEWLFTNTPYITGDQIDTDYNINLAESFLKKYSGYSKYTSEQSLPSLDVSIYDIPIKTGNNYFIWPYGSYKSSTLPVTRLQPNSITKLQIEDLATAGETVKESDTIFIETAKGVEGAWLRFEKFSSTDANIKALFKGNTKTEFRYPYPGFGLSGVGMTWSAPSLEYTPEFYFLRDEYKKLVETAYWNFNTGLTSVSALNIQNTTLIDQKAYASNLYTLADKITIWNTPPFQYEPLYSGDTVKSWLYKFTKTDIPLKPEGDTVFVWPYERIDSTATFPEYYPKTHACATTLLSSIPLNFQTASNVFEDSDKIYKLKNYTDTTETATECAWLSSSLVHFPYSSALVPLQPGLCINSKPGIATKFIWQGDNLTDINDVFEWVQHQTDCPFTYSSSTVTYKDVDKCTCKAVNFTPFGHPEGKFDNNIHLTDVILECTEFTDISTFDLANWRDRDGRSYKNSMNFAWFKTVSKTGFEKGKWVTEILNGVPRFKKGGIYIYLRASSNDADPESSTSGMPAFVSRYKYPTVSAKDFKWVTAKKQADNTWSNTGEFSNMFLNSKDIFLYTRASNLLFNLSGVQTSVVNIAENRGHIWANYDYVSVVNPQDSTSFITQTVYVQYPMVNFADPVAANSTLGTPLLNSNKVLYVDKWTLTDPDGVVMLYPQEEAFSFAPQKIGLYHISVDVVSGTQDTFVTNATGGYSFVKGVTASYSFNNIPPITAVSFLQNVTSLTGVSTPLPGYVLNVDLFGWDYSTSYPRITVTPGARPFWAKSITARDENTKYKSVQDWGSPVRVFDEHNIITQPAFSDVILKTGLYFEYDRKQSTSLEWNQPVINLIETNNKQWCTLDITTTGVTNLKNVLSNSEQSDNLVVVPLNTLSNIKITNIVDNVPVTVYYNAISSFTWSVTAIPEIQTYTVTDKDIKETLRADRPWNQMVNRFNTTVPQIPTLEDIYTKKDVGGYFLPSNLGTSLYNAKNYTYAVNTSSASLTSTFSSPDLYFAGRGNTKQDNIIPYDNLQEDASWLKESFNTGALAGNINREVAKDYQKFIPYQSSTESKAAKQTGINIISKKHTPWSGKNADTWNDKTSDPSNEAGIYNTSIWVEQNILNNDTKRIYNWATDIYGNQYALLKDITGKDVYEQKDVLGELWVLKTSKAAQPARIALDLVFDTYKGLQLYSELTGSGIKRIDVFFDTLYVETTGAVLFEKINYDYSSDTIFSFVDSTHILSLPLPVKTGLQREFSNDSRLSGVPCALVGDTWFLPEQKIALISVCGLSGSVVLPEIYELDISNETFKRVFPI